MNQRLIFLLLFWTVLVQGKSPPGTSPVPKVNQILLDYDSRVAKVKEHHKQLIERNLQLRPSKHLRFLPTNVTSIRRVRRRRNNAPKVRRFMNGLASGRVNQRFIRNSILRVRNPLFNRFRVRRRASGQMRCSLHVTIGGMQNFFQIGVVLIRLTFHSSCMADPFVKFVWVNSFDSSSHFQMRIGKQRYVLLYGTTTPRNSPFQQMVHYDTYKMLTLFRAANWSGRRTRGGRRRRSRQSPASTSRRRRPQTRTRGRSPANQGRSRRSSSARSLAQPRMLKEVDDPDKVKSLLATTDTDKEVQQDEERQLRRRRRRRRRGGRRRRRRGGRRRRRSPPSAQKRRQPTPVIPSSVRTHSVSRPVQASNPSSPSPSPVQPQRQPVMNIPDQPPSPSSSGPNISSFSKLLRRNDESGTVFSRRINEPVNIMPRIVWRSINSRREILSSGNPRQPFWQERVIRRIWKGQNPQIAPARPIPALRDAFVTMSV